MIKKQLAEGVYYVGVNDRQKALFENLWPLPYGVSYNSFLINDEKTLLVDTVDICYSDLFFKNVDAILGGRPLDYLLVNHMEPDHAGSIRLLRQYYPGVKIIGNKQTFGMLAGYHGITDGLHEVKEGDSLELGRHRLTFYMAPMVHWPEVMVAYEETEKMLFSADAFGTFGTVNGCILDADMNVDRYWDEMVRYYCNIVGKYGAPVQRALKKLAGLDIRTICPTHGPVWREHKEKAVGLYDRLSRYEAEPGVTIIYGSMYGNTELMAEAIAEGVAACGIKNIAMHHVAKSHPSYILSDVFKYKGVIVGSPTYNGQLFPGVEAMLKMIEARDIKDRLFGYFGSFTWAGTAVKQLSAFAETVKWPVVGTPVEQKQSITDEVYAQCIELGKAMAEAVR